MRSFFTSVALLGLFGLAGCKYTAGVCDCQYRDECHLKAPWVYRVAVPPPVQPAAHYNVRPGPQLIEEQGPIIRDLPMKQ
jgi:hypothetical protein